MLLKWIFRIFGALLIAFIGYVLNPFITNILTPPIKVSPELIRFQSIFKADTFKELEFPFSLINVRDKDFYVVWVKIIPVCPTMNPEKLCSSIKIEPQTLDPRYTRPLKTKYACLDCMRVDGIDENGLRCLWLVLYSIGANDKKTFNLILQDQSILSGQQYQPGVRLKTYGKYWQKPPFQEPIPFSHKQTEPGKGKARWPFQIPEDIKQVRCSPVFARMKNKQHEEQLGREPWSTRFSEVDPNAGFFSITPSDQGWLERNNNLVEIIPHITRRDFEIHLYRDTDNVLKALITNSFSKKAMLTYEDLERLKTHRAHPKHDIKVTWYKGENKLYIDGVLVDVYPKEVDSSLVKLEEGLFKVGQSDGDMFRALYNIGPEKGRIGFSISKEDWLKNNGKLIDIFPHIYISEQNFEVHGYRDEEYVFNFLISTSYSRNVILQFSDLERLKDHPEHPRHFVQLAWHNEEKKLYINEGEPVDTYPRKR